MAVTLNALTTGPGGLQTTGDTSGQIALQSNGSTVATVSSTGVAVTGTLSTTGAITSGGAVGSPYVMKNRIINGAMMISQRNGTSSVNVSGTTYVYQMDRFYMGGLNGVAVPFTLQQVSDAPTGYVNSVKLTTNTTDALGTAATEYEFQQTIEANNVSDFNLGTANAATVTLSFWVKSSLTGLFGLGIRNAPTFNRSYVATYTISAANTWEQKTVTLTLDTTGTWATSGNGAALNIAWSLGVGSNGRGTAGVWQAGGQVQTSSCVNVVSNAAATWQITGVQLEVGSTATSFEYKLYNQELAACQRYYWIKRGNDGTGQYQAIASGTCVSTSTPRVFLPYPVSMRAAPTVSYAGSVLVQTNGSAINVTGIPNNFNGTLGSMLEFSLTAGVTAGNGAVAYLGNLSGDYIQATAEI